jgi:hypothetical protein
MNAALTPSPLLYIWEQGQTRQSQPYQAIMTLLRATLPPDTTDTVDTWTIGQRDRYLSQVRERLFGPSMECVARCPECGKRAEFMLSTRDLRQPEIDMSEPLLLEGDGYRVVFRLPTLADLDAVAVSGARRMALLMRCIVQASRQGQAIEAEALPPELLDQIAARMGEADPQAYIELELECPDCGAQWQDPFDIVSYLWQELGTWARRVQREVHLIATAYGWSEAAILQLMPARRQAYINLILEKR